MNGEDDLATLPQMMEECHATHQEPKVKTRGIDLCNTEGFLKEMLGLKSCENGLVFPSRTFPKLFGFCVVITRRG